MGVTGPLELSRVHREHWPVKQQEGHATSRKPVSSPVKGRRSDWSAAARSSASRGGVPNEWERFGMRQERGGEDGMAADSTAAE